MKKLILAFAFALFSTVASAQCNGVFANNTVCGNITGASNLPRPTNPSAFLGAAGGTNGQIQYNNSGALGGFTLSGDCTIPVIASGAIICTKTNGVAFGTMAIQNANDVAITGGIIGVGTGQANGVTTLTVKGSNSLASADASGIAACYDETAFAINHGCRMFFGGKYNSGGNFAEFAAIAGIKENATDGNFAGSLAFYTRLAASGAWNAPAMTINSTGQAMIGTTTPSTSSKLTISDLGATTAYHSMVINRTEALNLIDTEGAQNAALSVNVTGNNISNGGGGAPIAQPVGVLTTVAQTGTGDAVGYFSSVANASNAGHAAFGIFTTVSTSNAAGGAVGLATNVSNQGGTDRVWASGGPFFFVGVDLPYGSTTAARGDAAALVRITQTGKWSCGYCIAGASVADWAYYSNAFTVDAAGNERALSNTATSDERLKNISGPFIRGLDDIAKIKPIRYRWKDNPDGPELGGLSAQNVQTAIPEAVSEDDKQMLGISDRPVVATLVNSVNALREQNERLLACNRRWTCRLFGE